MNDRERGRADTRQHILEVATRLFAEKGFSDTTIREICHAAHANVAAVNYHFRSKKRLYDAAWRYAYQITSEARDLNAQHDEARSPQEVIRAFVQARVEDAFSDGPPRYFREILMKEHAEPTPALRDIVLEVLKPQAERLSRAIAEMLGLEPDDHQVRLCVFSLAAQLVVLNAYRRVARRLFNGQPPVQLDADAMVEHITRFSFGGVRATQEASQVPASPDCMARHDPESMAWQ